GINPADRRHGNEQRTARPQNSVQLAQCPSRLRNQMQDVRADYAIPTIRRHIILLHEVGDDRCPRVAVIDVQDIHTVRCAKAARVVVSLELQTRAANGGRMLLEIALDEVAMDGEAAVHSEPVAQWWPNYCTNSCARETGQIAYASLNVHG